MEASLSSLITFLAVYAAQMILFAVLSGSPRFRLRFCVTGCIVGAFCVVVFHVSTVAVYTLVSLFFAFLTFFVSVRDSAPVLFLSFLMEECASGIVRCVFLIRNRFDEGLRSHPAERICVLFLYVIIYVCVRLFKNRETLSETTLRIQRLRYVAVSLMAVFLTVSATVFSLVLNEISEIRLRIPVVASLILSYLGIGSVVLFYVNIHRTNRVLQETLQKERLYRELINGYYAALLEKETATRQFRHDIKNHLLGLSHYLTDGDADGAQAYLRSMQASFGDIDQAVKITGNPLTDALLNHYRACLPDPDCMRVKGLLPEELPLDAYLFTTVFANLLQNATEAALSFEDPKDACIRLEFSDTKNFCSFTIENAFSPHAPKKYLAPSRADGHGYGLKNAEAAIRKMNGTIRYATGENTFFVSVSIPHIPVHM